MIQLIRNRPWILVILGIFIMMCFTLTLVVVATLNPREILH